MDALEGFQFVNHLIIKRHAVLLAEDAVLAEAPKIVPNDPQPIHEGVPRHPFDDPDVTVNEAPMPGLEIGRLVPVASHNSHHRTLLVVQIIDDVDLVQFTTTPRFRQDPVDDFGSVSASDG
jgi:hypothetical protein